MRLDEPGWWYDERAWFAPAALSPLSLVYGMVAGRRMQRKPQYRSRLPVLCVGNFTVGGSGKTPFAAFVCAWLAARGRRPAILTRGYGGASHGPLFVATSHDAAMVGDEALLLARVAPVMVARDRVAGAKAIESDLRGFDVIVMDDGLQNPTLAKTLTLALVTAQRGVGSGRTMPSGPLRAPLAVQARLADAVILLDGTPAMDAERRAALRARLSAETGRPVIEARVEAAAPPNLRGQRVIAYCGIAGPERFFATAEALGAHLIERVAFRDHHPLSEAEAAGLLGRARVADAVLVTTEKDIARLAGTTGPQGDLREASVAVPIKVEVSGPDAGQLDALLAQVIGLS